MYLKMPTTFRVWHVISVTHRSLSNENSLWEVHKLPGGRLFMDEEKILTSNHPLTSFTQRKTE